MRGIGVLCVVIGLVFAGWNTSLLVKAKASEGWKVAPGKVTYSTVSYASKSDSGPKYKVKVKYEYRVSGTVYKGSRLAYTSAASRFRSFSSAQQVEAQYTIGKSIQVYYNPEKPSQSVLLPGVHSLFSFLPGVIGFIVMLVGLAQAITGKNLIRFSVGTNR